MMAHLRKSIMFGDTIFYDAQRQVNLNLKQRSDLNSNTQDIIKVLHIYVQVLKRSE